MVALEAGLGKNCKQGVVTSDKMQKTITVRIDRREAHKFYGKIIKKITKLHVHDANSIAKIGDIVLIKQSRPYSKTKAWELVQVIGHIKEAMKDVV